MISVVKISKRTCLSFNFLHRLCDETSGPVASQFWCESESIELFVLMPVF